MIAGEEACLFFFSLRRVERRRAFFLLFSPPPRDNDARDPLFLFFFDHVWLPFLRNQTRSDFPFPPSAAFIWRRRRLSFEIREDDTAPPPPSPDGVERRPPALFPPFSVHIVNKKVSPFSFFFFLRHVHEEVFLLIVGISPLPLFLSATRWCLLEPLLKDFLSFFLQATRRGGCSLRAKWRPFSPIAFFFFFPPSLATPFPPIGHRFSFLPSCELQIQFLFSSPSVLSCRHLRT